MIGIVAPDSVTKKLVETAKQFLEKMQKGNYNAIWDTLITPEAARLLSTALFPVNAYNEGIIDEVLEPIADDLYSMSLDQIVTVGFQKNLKQIRSMFFDGMARGMRDIGWFNVSFEDCWAFVDNSAALLIATTPLTPLMLMFIEQNGEFRIDLEELVLFSMYIPASKLFEIGMRALKIGQHKSAIAYFELTASFLQPYARMRRLILDHPMLQHMITDARKQELLEEERYVLLARHQVLTLLSSPRLASKPVNMGRFLANTFKGYSKIPTIALNEQELEYLYELDDGYLRKAISSILEGVNPVVAQREASKPHGSHEISDMELAVQHGDEIYRLSMPFKSGLEINESRAPVKIAYQIIRPFLYFPDGVVVFITAKPCSQHLHNYIKAANDILGLSIEVIENEELGKLLKVNGLLL